MFSRQQNNEKLDEVWIADSPAVVNKLSKTKIAADLAESVVSLEMLVDFVRHEALQLAVDLRQVEDDVVDSWDHLLADRTTGRTDVLHVEFEFVLGLKVDPS